MSEVPVGIGGAPIRAASLPSDPAARKKIPIASGFLNYFPDAVAAVSLLSQRGNDQHNKGQPLHWARAKSGDEDDTMMRHFLCRGMDDDDGIPHTWKLAWRSMAYLQKEIESELADGRNPVERVAIELARIARPRPEVSPEVLERPLQTFGDSAYPELNAPTRSPESEISQNAAAIR